MRISRARGSTALVVRDRLMPRLSRVLRRVPTIPAALLAVAMSAPAADAQSIVPALIGVLLAAVTRTSRARGMARASVSGPQPTMAQRVARLRQTLSYLSGWQYTLRLSISVTVAAALNLLWPDHHLYWVALTASLLIERKIEAFPVRVTKRTVGTVLGVLLAGLLLAFKPPFWGLTAGIGVLAGARTLLRVRNYLAYSVVMTPLIILIMDAGLWPLAGHSASAH